jgi:beta-lactamase class D OXA-10
MMKKIGLLWLMLCWSALSYAEPLVENKQWQQTYDDARMTGVMLICKNDTTHCTTNNKQRAATAYLPASTYKIPHLLIALETGVLTDPKQVFKWDGQARALKTWEHDFTLRGAMQNSVVPIFQSFAQQIGEKNMQHYLATWNYGNQEVNGGIDHFWLDGQLRISALQQIAWLEKLNTGKFKAKPVNQWIVKDTLVAEATPDYLLRAKTGYTLGDPRYGDRTKPGVGWWIGWVETSTDTYYFASNLDITDDKQLPLRKSIPLQLMQAQSILPNKS